MKERLFYIDILKALGILLVVMGHVLNDAFNPAFHFIYAFHMPLFFMLSGMFFNYGNKTSFNSLIKKRWENLLKPYLFFYIVTFLYWVLIERSLRAEAGGVEAEWYKPLMGLIWQSSSSNMFAHNNPLWFIPCLMSVTILAWLSSLFSKTWHRVIFAIATLTLYGIIRYTPIPLPFELRVAFLAFVFFFSGSLLKLLTSTKTRGGVLIFLIPLDIYLFNLYPTNKPNLSILGLTMEYFPYYYVRAIVTIIILAILASKTERFIRNIKVKTAIEFIGRNTLIILCLHGPITRAVIFAASKLTHTPIDIIRKDVFYSIICTAIVMIVLTPIIWLYNKHVKRLLHFA